MVGALSVLGDLEFIGALLVAGGLGVVKTLGHVGMGALGVPGASEVVETLGVIGVMRGRGPSGSFRGLKFAEDLGTMAISGETGALREDELSQRVVGEGCGLQTVVNGLHLDHVVIMSRSDTSWLNGL